MIKLYDEAIVAKINKWVKDPNLKVISPNDVNRLFQIKVDEANDKPLTLPMIAISRDPNVEILVNHRRSLSADGLKLDSNEKTSVQLDAIPININYQLDVYTGGIDPNTGQPTDGYEMGDIYVRNLIFNLINYPKLVIEIPYNGSHIEHVANIFLDPNVTDNSDVAERRFPSQFTRWSIRFAINDAFLFSVPVRDNSKIVGVELEVKDVQPGDDTITPEYIAPGYEVEE